MRRREALVEDRPSDESAAFFNTGFTNRSKRGKKEVKKPMTTSTSTQVRKPLAEPASTAASDAPFKIVQGIQAEEQWLKLFFYGDYGAGKTVLAASAVDVEDMQDVLIINIEAGLTSIIGSKAVRNTKYIDSIPVKTFEEFVYVHRMLLAYCQARDDGDKERLKRMAEKYQFPPLAKRRYRTLIIDSMSELNQVSLARAFGENQDDLLNTTDSDDTRRDFGRNKQAMVKAIRAMRNLPLHVIATCGKDDIDPERKRFKRQPRLTGALAKEVQAFWDVVGLLETATGTSEIKDGEDEKVILRRLWLQPMGKWDAKNRLSSQDVTYLDDPNMEKLVGLLTADTVRK
jgi:GTPase SAR1 family protein